MPILRIPLAQGISQRRDGFLQEALQGHAVNVVGADPYSHPGRLVSAYAPSNFTFSGTPVILRDIVTTPTGTRFAISKGDGLYQLVGSIWTKIATTTSPSDEWGVEFFRDFIYYTSGSLTFGRYGPLSGAAAVTNVWQTLSSGRSSRIKAKNDFLWLGKSSGVLSVRPSVASWDNSTFAEDDLILEDSGANITSISETPDLLLVSLDSSRVYAWDMAEDGWNFDFKVKGIPRAMEYCEGVTYIITGTSAYAMLQSNRIPRHLFDWPVRFRDNEEFQEINVGDAACWGRLVMVSTNRALGDPSMPFGVWAFPRINFVEDPMPFQYYQETTLAITDAGVHGLLGTNNNLYLSKVTSGSVVQASVITGANTTSRQSGTWDTQYLDFGFPDYDKEIYKLEVIHDPLASGETVVLSTAKDYGDSYTTQVTSDTVGAVKKTLPVKGVRGRKLSVRVSPTARAKAKDLIVGYRILPRAI